MNKQEALEAALTEARRYEEPNREVRAWEEDQIQDALLEAARELDHLVARLRSGDVTARTEAQYRQRLVRLAGASLELLVTEVMLVDGSDPRPMAVREALRTPLYPGVSAPCTDMGVGSYQPVPVNGLLRRYEPKQLPGNPGGC